MTFYKIQTYQHAVGGYETVMSFKPDYVWAVTKIWRRWWFPWPRIEVGVVKNLRPAEERALKRALIQARISWRRTKISTRLQRVVQLCGKETKTIVWCNGDVLDLAILPWYMRILRELWLAIRRKR